MSDGYFSKKLKRTFAQEVKESENFFYELKLGIGKCGFINLSEVSEYLFKIMDTLREKRARFLRENKGYIKRFFIVYDNYSYMYEPYFKFLFLSFKTKADIEVFEFKLKSYMRWFSVWCRLNKNFDDITVKLEPLENEKAEEIINNFFKQPVIEENSMIDEEERKSILKNHNTVSLGGIFKNIKQKYLSSVER